MAGMPIRDGIDRRRHADATATRHGRATGATRTRLMSTPARHDSDGRAAGTRRQPGVIAALQMARGWGHGRSARAFVIGWTLAQV